MNEYDEAEDADQMNRRFDDPRRQAEQKATQGKKVAAAADILDALLG
jgi:hypothetical protein